MKKAEKMKKNRWKKPMNYNCGKKGALAGKNYLFLLFLKASATFFTFWSFDSEAALFSF